MKRWTIILLGLILLFTSVCSAKSIDEARQTLAQLKLNFDDQQFLDVIRKKDNYAVSLFLDAGMNPNLVTNSNVSPLKIASIFGNIDAVRLLLSREGIDANWKDYGGRTAADIAYLFDNNNIVSLLKEKDAVQSAAKQFALAPAQISQALSIGETSAVNKKDIIFAEKDAKGNLQIRAYWVSPFCALANEKLTAVKRYEEIMPERLRILANTYQVKIVFPVAPGQANQDYTEGLKVVGIQNGKILYPYWTETVSMQQTTTTVVFVPVTMYKRGIVAYFNAHDIDLSKPIEIKAISKAAEEVTFKFSNANATNLVYWDSENGQFNW